MRFIRRFRDWPLRAKLLVLLVAASALPLAMTTFLEFRSAGSLIQQSAVALLAARADQLAGHLDAFHASFRGASERLAAFPVLKRFCSLPPSERARVEPEIETTLAAYTQTDARTHLVAIFDTHGTVSASTNAAVVGRNYAFRRYFQSALAGKITTSDLFLSVAEAGGIPTIAYASPVWDRTHDRVACVALIVARGEAFWDAVTEQNGSAGAGSYSVVYDEYGVRIAHSSKEAELFHPAGPLDAAVVSMLVADRRFGDDTRKLLEAAIPRPEEFSRVRSGKIEGEFVAPGSANGVFNLVAGRRLKTVPWTLFYLVPESTVDAPVHQLIRDTASANGGILALALVAGLVLARSITSPVRGLTRAARAIREGDLSAHVGVRSLDELGELASSFNSMVASLRAAREELEEKVRARTEALRTANDSLEVRNETLAQRTAELTVRQQRDLAHGRALTALSGEGGLSPVLEAALREASAFSGAALIACFRVAGQRLTPIAQVGLALAAGGPLPLTGAAEEVFESRRTIVLDSLPDDVELRFDAVLATGRPRSVALVPLMVGHRHIGVLAVGALKSFDPASLTFLSDLAVPLALTIARHDLHRQTNEFAEQLSKTNEELQLQTEELQSQRQDLEEKNLQIRKADQLKSEFLANMSHELRTPLNAIIGFSELLLEEGRASLSPEHVKFVADVLASGRHLLALINDILDLAKIEAGRIELQLEPLAPAAVISEAVSLIAPQAQRKSIEVRSHVAASTTILADRGKLRQILLNLLSNAVKFSGDGTGVEIGAEDVSSGVRFWVRDQGPGMDETLISGLFQPFVQGDSTLVKKHQGTGLGLAISRRVAEEHGGTIEVKSAPGQGSMFSVTLPTVGANAPWTADAALLEPPSKQAPASLSRPPPQPQPQETPEKLPLVLLVEDDVATVRLVRAYLRDAGYELAEASNRGNALELARRLQPAAILLDLDLGGEDGLDLLKELKADPATRNIPVVIQSVLAEQKRGLLLGASDYLMKPLDRNRLLESIGRCRYSDGAQPLVLAIDDDPVVAAILRSVLAPAGFRLKTAALGREGIDIARSEQPALIIVDLLLPDISGFEVVDALGADPRTAKVPVIALTAANLSAGDRTRLEKRVSSLAQKGDFTRDAVLLAVQRAIGATPAGRGTGPTMLVVDDHDLNRELIRTLLERKGYRVLLAGTGEAGIEIARRERPSLILLDLAMPGKDGFATARELKADGALAATPLVAVTAMAMRGDEERAKQAGFDAYVTKPVDPRVLEATVERLLTA
jgi:CheY-like chemotaxis protein/signal transduction histidine kinase/HAMP domain-containing protein